MYVRSPSECGLVGVVLGAGGGALYRHVTVSAAIHGKVPSRVLKFIQHMGISTLTDVDDCKDDQEDHSSVKCRL